MAAEVELDELQPDRSFWLYEDKSETSYFAVKVEIQVLNKAAAEFISLNHGSYEVQRMLDRVSAVCGASFSVFSFQWLLCVSSGPLYVSSPLLSSPSLFQHAPRTRTATVCRRWSASHAKSESRRASTELAGAHFATSATDATA